MPSIQKTLLMFEYIKNYIRRNKFAPTIEEIGRQFDLRSPASVYDHLIKMENKGWIVRSRRWRGIEIVEQEQTRAA